MVASSKRLSTRAADLMRDPQTELVLSAASSWELAIKYSLGRINLPDPPEKYVPDRMRATGVESLPVTHSHALRVARLEAHHRDPFDRLLIAQAQVERLTIITADPVFSQYQVKVISAV
jgi:PIN domain nuclease of toxin-antitoxin system